MNRWARLWNRLFLGLFFCAGAYILCAGVLRFGGPDISAILRSGRESAGRIWQFEAARSLYPGLFYGYEEDGEETALFDWYIQQVLRLHPLTRLSMAAEKQGSLESAATMEMLVTGGVQDENEVDEDGQEYDTAQLALEENTQAAKERAEEEQKQAEAETEEESPQAQVTAAGTIYTLEELSDFDFLFGNFYTMENNTSITAEELNAETLLNKDMHIDTDTDGPQILIYHTHSQEGFADSTPGDNSTTIVGVGAYLAELLEEKGYQVLHVTSVYDLVDGKLDRNEAYSKAQEEISAILAQQPSIQAVIDLHRDGVEEGTRLVTEVNGKTTAKFMFMNGLSRSKKNGPIDYLYNPYIEDNLALTLQLKLACEQYYPGLSRNIYLKSLRYNLHLSDKALLIEAGAQTNTLQEVLNAMEPLADVLAKVWG